MANLIKRHTFGVQQRRFPIENLNEMQIDSFRKFWESEIPKILKEFSPIEDKLGNRWKIELGPKYFLEPDGKVSERDAILRGLTYGALLYVQVTVQNLVNKKKKTQRVFVGRVPMMTKKGNFIVNGTQKVVAGQLVKSPGVIYSSQIDKGYQTITTKVIPSRGAWIEFILGKDNAIYARIDRKKKFPATQLLRLYGIESDENIKSLFSAVDVDDKISYIQATLDKDNTSSANEAVNSIYKKIRPGDIVSIEQGKEFLTGMFADANRYDFGEVGRYKFDSRLDIVSKPTKGENYKKVLDIEDIIKVLQEIIDFKIQEKPSDGIDALDNRRVRTVSEWLTRTFKAGLTRVVKNVKDKMTTHEDVDFTPAQLVNMRPLAALVDDFFNTSQLSRFMDQTNIISELDDRHFLTATGPGGLTKDRAGFEVRDVHPSHYGRLCPINTPEGGSFGLNSHLAIHAKINEKGFIETPYYKTKSVLKPFDKDLLSRTVVEDVVFNGKKILKKGSLITQDALEMLQQTAPEADVKVKKFVSKEVVYLDSQKELCAVICGQIAEIDDMGHFLIETTGGRRNGEPTQVKTADVDYVDVSYSQILSLSTCMIPFVSQTDGFRVLMGTNQQGQALPLVRPELPYVATGFEAIAARDSGYMETSPVDGTVIKADGKSVIVKDDKTKEEYYFEIIKYLPSNNHSAINQKVLVKEGQKVKKGDFLAEGFGIYNGEFAIGQNVRVAFMPFKGYNFEDAVVLSERLVKKDKFTSNHIYELVSDVHETRLGNEEITKDIPNVAVDKLNKLDENGIIHIGAYVESGDILVGKVTPKGETDLSPEDKLIRVLFGDYSKDVKNSSLFLEHGLSGKVVSTRILSRENGDALPNDVLQRVHIWLAITRKIQPGDKMAGRHGNKGVVSVVLSEEDMPYTEDGRSIDVVLNPLGVIGRMNLGQLLETHLGLVCEKNNILALTQPLNDISAETIQQELIEAGFPSDGKMPLRDGQTGEVYDRPVVVGNLYLNKLHHLVDDKMHTRSTGPYSLVTQQPLGGRSHSGGQRFGEMEVWALEAYGAAYALQEMLTIKSDDVKGREAAFESIVRGKPITSPNLPGSFVVLANELTALGLKVNAKVTPSLDEKKIDKKLALSVDEGNLNK